MDGQRLPRGGAVRAGDLRPEDKNLSAPVVMTCKRLLLPFLAIGCLNTSTVFALERTAERLVAVPVPEATCIAVSDAHGLAVAGRWSSDGPHLFVFRLDEEGTPSATPPDTLATPCPETLRAQAHGPVAIFFHPIHPRLYVWQDLGPKREVDPWREQILASFDHLLVYVIEEDGLRLEQALGRGLEYGYGQVRGALTTDPGGRRLFVPNLYNPVDPKNPYMPGRTCIGYFDLDEIGRPKPRRVAVEGEMDERGLQTFAWRVRPTRTDVGQVRDFPVGLGFVAPNADVVLVGGMFNGPAVWDTGNRRAPLGIIRIRRPPPPDIVPVDPGPRTPVRDAQGLSHDNIIAAHPVLPLIYGATLGDAHLYRLAHADGYPTMMPTVTAVEGARFQSAPVVTGAGHDRLVIGGDAALHVVGLDASGHFTGQRHAIAVNAKQVTTLAWSHAFQRLYVPVEKTP